MTVDNELLELYELDKQIQYHADLFFKHDTSEISDSEYDTLVARFEALAKLHPEEASELTSHTAAVPISDKGTELDTVVMATSMLSLRKALTKEQLATAMELFPKDEDVVYEYKLDGMALDIEYNFGKLKSISSRWDGIVGEDVTHALPLFKNIPGFLEEVKHLETYNIRGEGYITNKDFDDYCKVAITKPKSPRNSVSGWIRSLPENQNPLVIGLLSFSAYYSSYRFGESTYVGMMNHVMDMGFDIPERLTPKYVENDIRCNKVPVDGIVIKLNKFSAQEDMGSTSKHPRWAVAYKFPPMGATTAITDVVWQVGRTGNVVPVAEFKPVHLMGADCRRATIFNYRSFMQIGLRKGTIVQITRNGDIIPQVAAVIEVGTGARIKAPKNCPSCDSVLQMDGGNAEAVHLRCSNVSSCPAQLIQRVINLTDKNGFDIKDVGPTLISHYITNGFIKRPSDIFDITEEMIGKKIKTAIENSRQVPLNRFIKALSLPAVGDVGSYKLAVALSSNFDGMEEFFRNPAKMEEIDDIGLGTAMDVARRFEDKDFLEFYYDLLKKVTLIPVVATNVTHRICITGSLDMTRGELEEYFSTHGIEVHDRVTKGTCFVLKGNKPSQSKIDKAIKMGIGYAEFSSFQSLEKAVAFIKELK